MPSVMAKKIFLWRISYGEYPIAYGENRNPYVDNQTTYGGYRSCYGEISDRLWRISNRYGENHIALWRKLFWYGENSLGSIMTETTLRETPFGGLAHYGDV